MNSCRIPLDAPEFTDRVAVCVENQQLDAVPVHCCGAEANAKVEFRPDGLECAGGPDETTVVVETEAALQAVDLHPARQIVARVVSEHGDVDRRCELEVGELAL